MGVRLPAQRGHWKRSRTQSSHPVQCTSLPVLVQAQVWVHIPGWPSKCSAEERYNNKTSWTLFRPMPSNTLSCTPAGFLKWEQAVTQNDDTGRVEVVGPECLRHWTQDREVRGSNPFLGSKHLNPFCFVSGYGRANVKDQMVADRSCPGKIV